MRSSVLYARNWEMSLASTLLGFVSILTWLTSGNGDPSVAFIHTRISVIMFRTHSATHCCNTFMTTQLLDTWVLQRLSLAFRSEFIGQG